MIFVAVLGDNIGKRMCLNQFLIMLRSLLYDGATVSSALC